MPTGGESVRNHDHHLTDQELLSALDHELPARQRTVVELHLGQCVDCQARRARVNLTVRTFGAFYEREVTVPSESTLTARERLRATLNEGGGARSRPWPVRLSSGFMSIPRWVMAGMAVAAIVLLIRVVSLPRLIDPSSAASRAERDALPDATLTPGATWNLTLGELCATGTREQRAVAPAIRRHVLRDYGMESVPPDEYELDYLITPELGGAPDPRNLWPQRYASRVWNAHVKDQLERLLPHLVCDRQLPLEVAQRDIALDWIAAYKKYFRTDVPRQTQAGLLRQDDANSRERDGVNYPVWRSPDASPLELIAFSPQR